MKLSFKLWLLIVLVIFASIAIFSLPPAFMQKGLIVKEVEQNSTISLAGLKQGMIILEINGKSLESIQDYAAAMSLFDDNATHKLSIKTNSITIIDIFSPLVREQVVVSEIPNTRIKTGLDIQGGARALVTAEDPLSDSQLDDLLAVSQQRLNTYGLSDVQLRKATDLSGNKYMIVEIAGSSPADLQSLIAQQGKFEAKIGNETAFVGGAEDVTYVGRTGQDAGIRECNQISGGGYACTFQFVISLSPKAADHYANITKDLGTNASNPGYLDKTIDFYLDGKLTESLLISEELRGSSTTQHSIQGSGMGATQQEALDSAKLNMKKLQTILITGSLPFKLQIVKSENISPVLGENFSNKILLAGLVSLLSVFVVVFIRYRRLKISLAMFVTLAAEVVIILGIAALIGWNLDLPSIAGIIAVIGTGVDQMIIIADEAKSNIHEPLKVRIKNALLIIVAAYFTAVVSLLPLYWAGAGLLKGFAVTSLIGITIGVLVTRPAFSDLVKRIEE